MNKLEEKIDLDLKSALKEHDSDRVSVLRLLKNALKNASLSKGSNLTDDEAVAVASKQAKQRSDSIEQYKKGGREDLAQKEEYELSVIEGYLPAKISRQEAIIIVDKAISDLGVNDISGMGKVMGQVKASAGASFDGALFSEIIREKLL